MKMMKKLLFAICLISGNVFADGFVHRNDVKAGNGWIKEIKETSGLKVMFWNVGCFYEKDGKNQIPRFRHNESSANLMQNITKLVGNEKLRPDVIIFGEHCKQPFDNSGVSDLLNDHYPYNYVRDRYNRFYERDNGMTIYSRFEIEDPKTVMLQSGGWMKTDYMVQCERKYGDEITGANSFDPDSWDRPYLTFNVKKAKKKYQIVGVHLPNPWPLMMKCRGTLNTGLSMWKGTHNPNYRQGNILATRFNRNSKNTLMIGDFNAPKRQSVSKFGFTIHVTSNTYKRVAASMGESEIKSSAPTGIHQGHDGTRTSIDHAFASDDLNVKLGRILPLAGSDHLPIYIILK